MKETARDRAAKPLYLIAGDYRDYFSIRNIVETLPNDAYGQIFIEITDPEQIQDFDRPRRMQLTWLTVGNTDSSAQSDTRLCQAVTGWLAEWQVADGEQHQKLELWLGGIMNPQVSAQWQNLSMQLNAQSHPSE